jgi:hypothetical protein
MDGEEEWDDFGEPESTNGDEFDEFGEDAGWEEEVSSQPTLTECVMGK